jgi:thiol peroxidase
LEDTVAVLTISWDLPFAQKRWCDEKSVSHTLLLSDYRDRAFGKAYGLIIKERMLLARAVLVIDRQGKIQYIQIVKEQFSQPDYDKLLVALHKIMESV